MSKNHVAGTLSAGYISRVGILSAIGIILGYLTLSIPILGQQVKLDFSHLGTIVAAIFLGPLAGLVTGLIVGIPPSIVLGNPLIAPIKALTGLIIGWLFPRIRSPFFTVILGYIPESLLTYLTLGVLGIPYLLPAPILYTILLKAWGEMVFLAILAELLWRSSLFRQVISGRRN